MSISAANVLRGLSLFLATSLFACGTDGPSSSTPRNLPFDVETGANKIESPTEATPLLHVADEAAKNVLYATNQRIDIARVRNLDKVKEMYKQAALKRGMNASLLDKLDDETIQEKWAAMYPLGPTMVKIGTDEAAQSASISQASFAINDEPSWEELRRCPLLAPEPTQGSTPPDPCAPLIAEVDQLYQAQIDEAITIEVAEIEESFANPDNAFVQNILEQLDETDVEAAKQFMIDWASEAITFANQAARMAMIEELRDNNECDSEMDRPAACRLAGVNDAVVMTTEYRYFNDMTAWEVVEELDGTCSLNWMSTISMIREVLLSRVAEFIHEEHFCVGFDYNRDNPAYLDCNDIRREGVVEGIENEIVRMSMILQGFTNTNCPEPGDGGGNGDGAGDPLVVDLDGDGISLAEHQVSFDMFASGSKNRITWVGPREGLVALDLNGNGTIDSMAELFGDQGYCGSERCTDGIASLAQHDTNGDGRIDEADPVFTGLLLWVDANQDGVSQASELAPLFSAGVTSIGLKTAPMSEAEFGKPGIARVPLQTAAGTLFAYDVVFRVVPTMATLGEFGPQRRN